jgi:mono/diheme cytochrome c family protein
MLLRQEANMKRSGLTVFPAVLLLAVASVKTASLEQGSTPARAAPPSTSLGLAAWQEIYSVMSHPRCINCHTGSDYPQQGDHRHRHLFNVVRGPEGKGVPALQCATCHQSANADSTGVPGAPGWHLAPLSIKWQDANDNILSSSAVCKIVSDPKKNGGLDGAALVKHHQTELVKWAWKPGFRNDGTARSTPPINYEQFMAATRTWVQVGMPCPE